MPRTNRNNNNNNSHTNGGSGRNKGNGLNIVIPPHNSSSSIPVSTLANSTGNTQSSSASSSAPIASRAGAWPMITPFTSPFLASPLVPQTFGPVLSMSSLAQAAVVAAAASSSSSSSSSSSHRAESTMSSLETSETTIPKRRPSKNRSAKKSSKKESLKLPSLDADCKVDRGFVIDCNDYRQSDNDEDDDNKEDNSSHLYSNGTLNRQMMNTSLLTPTFNGTSSFRSAMSAAQSGIPTTVKREATKEEDGRIMKRGRRNRTIMKSESDSTNSSLDSSPDTHHEKMTVPTSNLLFPAIASPSALSSLNAAAAAANLAKINASLNGGNPSPVATASTTGLPNFGALNPSVFQLMAAAAASQPTCVTPTAAAANLFSQVPFPTFGMANPLAAAQAAQAAQQTAQAFAAAASMMNHSTLNGARNVHKRSRRLAEQTDVQYSSDSSSCSDSDGTRTSNNRRKDLSRSRRHRSRSGRINVDSSSNSRKASSTLPNKRQKRISTVSHLLPSLKKKSSMVNSQSGHHLMVNSTVPIVGNHHIQSSSTTMNRSLLSGLISKPSSTTTTNTTTTTSSSSEGYSLPRLVGSSKYDNKSLNLAFEYILTSGIIETATAGMINSEKNHGSKNTNTISSKSPDYRNIYNTDDNNFCSSAANPASSSSSSSSSMNDSSSHSEDLVIKNVKKNLSCSINLNRDYLQKQMKELEFEVSGSLVDISTVLELFQPRDRGHYTMGLSKTEKTERRKTQNREAAYRARKRAQFLNCMAIQLNTENVALKSWVCSALERESTMKDEISRLENEILQLKRTDHSSGVISDFHSAALMEACQASNDIDDCDDEGDHIDVEDDDSEADALMADALAQFTGDSDSTRSTSATRRRQTIVRV